MGGKGLKRFVGFLAYDSISSFHPKNVVTRNPDPVLPSGTRSDDRSFILSVNWPPVVSPASVILLQ